MWRVRDRLFLGDYRSGERAIAGEERPVAPDGRSAPFAGVVSLCAFPLLVTGPAPHPKHLETQWLQVPIADGGAGESEFETALRLVSPFVRRRQRAGNVLIHCAAGMSRSVSMIAALLCEEGLTPEAAFELVAQAKAAALDIPASSATLLIAPAAEFRAYLFRHHGASRAADSSPTKRGLD